MNTASSPAQTICVISPLQLQNGFIVRLLEKERGRKCLTAESLDEARSNLGRDYDRITLFLWDCWNKDLAHAIDGFKKAIDGLLPKNSIVGFFNVKRKGRENSKTLPSQVKGIFFVGASAEDFLKWVSCMLEGKSWLALDKGVCVGNDCSQNELLTRREKAILSLIQRGKSNQQIADALGVKYKTIKNHCNNLFRKLKVSNRVQAALRAKDR